MEHAFGWWRRGRAGRASVDVEQWARQDVVETASAAPVPPPSGEGLLLGGRYRLGELLGEGGEARIFLAEDLTLHRPVAVKLFHPRVEATERRLREFETQVAAALNHYALTTMFDAGIDREPGGVARIFLVMEYVRGQSLRQRLLAGPMSLSEVCWLGFDLAEGLDSMHQSGYVHRDVKPGNILISGARSARPVIAKLTDFGIAARVGEPDLSEWTVGTAAYLSPEQVEGHDAGPGSDVYSLGLVLLEAMTGRVAFPGNVEQSAFERLVRDPVIPTDLPEPVRVLLAWMTRREVAARAEPMQVAVQLQQILADDLVARRAPVPAAGPAAAAVGEAVQVESPQARLVLDLVLQTTAAVQVALTAGDEVLRAGISAKDEAASTLVGPDRLLRVAVPSGDGHRQAWLQAAADSRPFSTEDRARMQGFAELLGRDLDLRRAVRRAMFRD